MKFEPLFSNKSKKEKANKAKKDINHQLLEAEVRLQALKKKYRVMIEQDIKQIKYSKLHHQDNPKAVQHLKNCYYSLGVVYQASDQLRDIISEQELCQSINEMGNTLRLINGLYGKTEKVRVRRVRGGISKMGKNEEKGGQRLDNVFGTSIDDLVDDSVIDQLVKGADVVDCLEAADGIIYGPSEIEPISLDELSGLDAEGDIEASMANIEELMKDL